MLRDELFAFSESREDPVYADLPMYPSGTQKVIEFGPLILRKNDAALDLNLSLDSISLEEPLEAFVYSPYAFLHRPNQRNVVLSDQ